MIQEIIAKEGYVHIPDFFEIEESKTLERKLAKYIEKLKIESFTYSLLSLNEDERIEVSALVREYFKNKLADKLSGFKFITGSFLIKPPKDQAIMALHQDWSYVMPNKYPIYTCWAPLIDTDQESGSLFFVKGSHLFLENLRSKEYETARITELNDFGDSLKTIKVKKGDVVLFDPAVFHGSHPNHQDNPRTAITCLTTLKEANILYFGKQDEKHCQAVEIGDDGIERYLEFLVKGEIPQHLKKTPLIPYLHKVPKLEELLSKSKI